MGAGMGAESDKIEQRLLARRDRRRAEGPVLRRGSGAMHGTGSRDSDTRAPGGGHEGDARAGPGAVSFGQERMWLFEQLATATSVSNCAFVVRVRGALDRPALVNSLRELQLRQEILRTVYTLEGGELRQRVLPESAPVHVEDLAGEADPVGRALEFAVAAANRPYALDREPPVRWSLFAVGADDHMLVMCFHHICTDGWSESIINRELSALYAAFRTGRPSPLPEPPVQYAEFAAWQRAQLAGPAAEKSVRFWRERLAGAPDSLRLPFDHPATARTGFTGATAGHRLGRVLAGRVRQFSRRERVTEFMVLLAAFAALLKHHSGQEDMVIGAPVAGRAHPEVEGLVGYFVNTVAFRIDLSGTPSFRSLVRRVRGSVLASLPHQHVPFERVVQEVRPGAPPGRPRLVQAMFHLHNTPAEPLRLDGLETELEQIFPHASALDLIVAFDPEDADLRGVWSYRDALFEEPTVRRLQRQYAHVLDLLLGAPDTSLDTISTLA